MYIESAQVTITGSPIAVSSILANTSIFLAAKIRIQSQAANSGTIQVGDSSVPTSPGAHTYKTLIAPAANQPLPEFLEESQSDRNTLDTRAYWINGSHNGDTVLVTVEHN